jgi:hypothetical protein
MSLAERGSVESGAVTSRCPHQVPRETVGADPAIKTLFNEVSLSSRSGDTICRRSVLRSPWCREMVVMADDAGRESPAERPAISGGTNNGEHQHHRDR